MRRTTSSGSTIRRAVLGLIALAALIVPAPLAASAAPPAGQASSLVELPGASSAEGIAAGRGTTFYAGDLGRGDIFRGDIRTGTAELFIDAPDGRAAVGMYMDRRHDLLFVAGGDTGQGYVYDTNTGATVASYQLSDGPAFINDVTVTYAGAWFTNSLRGELYFVPVNVFGEPGTVRTLELTGPAADTGSAFNLNGIASVLGGFRLVVAHSGNGALYTVNPSTGASAQIAGVSVPNVDGIVTRGNSLWAVQNRLDQISRIQLGFFAASGTVREVITSPLFRTPTTAALFGNTLAVVNAKFFYPGATTYEVVLVRAHSRTP